MEYIKKYKVLVLIPIIILVFFMLFKQDKKQMIKVDLKGCVNKPGVYEIVDGSRVEDLIKESGGVKKNADLIRLNLSEILVDEIIVNVDCIIVEEPDLIVPNDEISENKNEINNKDVINQNPPVNKSNKISINSSNISELQNLPGIGQSKAKAIVEYRNVNGPFRILDDLKNVSGIGNATYELLKDKISL